jgi:hypothetical protein
MLDMRKSVTPLRNQLSELRDASLAFFDAAEGFLREATDPYHSRSTLWSRLPEEFQTVADNLRGELRPLMARISNALRGSSVISEADFRDVGWHSKTMAAALRLREYRQWGPRVLSDEDQVLGIVPPGQEESEIDSVADARSLFTESYRAVTEMMDYWSPQDVAMMPPGADSRGQPVRSYRQNTAFLLMWINPEAPELNDVRDTVQEVFKSFNIKATRADEIEHEGIITERVIQEISTSEFLFADLTGERPSVYYEVGYAHAIGKRVILFKKKGTKIHFDLAAYNCPDYESLGDLRRNLLTAFRHSRTESRPKPNSADPLVPSYVAHSPLIWESELRRHLQLGAIQRKAGGSSPEAMRAVRGV